MKKARQCFKRCICNWVLSARFVGQEIRKVAGMRIVKEKIWTWFLPDKERQVNPDAWRSYGGKWLVFDRLEKIMALARYSDFQLSGMTIFSRGRRNLRTGDGSCG